MNIVIDYASVDTNLTPDFKALAAACRAVGSTLSGVIFRGAWGTFADPTISSDWMRARGDGLITGAYLYLRSRENIDDQVHVFAKNVGALTESDFVPALDVEDTWPSAEAELAAVHAAWTAMKAVYGVPPIIYDSARVWAEDLHNLPAGEMTLSPQWVAKPWPWPIHSRPMLAPGPFLSGNYEPAVPRPWGPNNWWLHQYQGDAYHVPGFSNTIDLSRFRLMREGETGARVRWVQQRLGMPQTGVYDAAMASRVRAFQSAKGIRADAIIGPVTFNRIAWLPLPA